MAPSLDDCPICENQSTTVFDASLKLRHCPSCDHTFAALAKEEQETYGDGYFYDVHKNWFENPNYPFFDVVLKKARERFGKGPMRMIDVGCGKGDFLRYVVDRDPDLDLSGLDLVDNEHPSIHFMRGDVLDPEVERRMKQRFDVVVSFAVIEHVDDPRLFARRLWDLLNDGGYAVVMTIDNDSMMYRIARVLRRVGIDVAFNRLYDHHHLQHYNKASLRRLLMDQGFSLHQQWNHNFPLAAVDVPQGNPLMARAYKLAVAIIFFVSSLLRMEINQTILVGKPKSA